LRKIFLKLEKSCLTHCFTLIHHFLPSASQLRDLQAQRKKKQKKLQVGRRRQILPLLLLAVVAIGDDREKAKQA